MKFTGFYELKRDLSPSATDYYLELLGDYLDNLTVHSTAGDIRPPYAFQWLAKAKHFDGDDDCFEGLGGSAHEAVKDLYKQIKNFYQKEHCVDANGYCNMGCC